MKARVANMLICRHFDKWVESIEDAAVKEAVRKNTILTGGALVTLLTTNDVNDFDYYFRNRETALLVAKYYVQKFKENPPAKFKDGRHVDLYVDTKDPGGRVKIVAKSAGIVGEGSTANAAYGYFENESTTEGQEKFLNAATEVNTEAAPQTADGKTRKPFRPVYLTANAITLSDKVQLVIRFYGEPDQIHENYDFVHVTNYWTSWDRKVVLRAEALECILAKELRYIGSRYPVCSLIRVRKFIERGWTITGGQLLKIVFNLREFDLTNFAVLEEQLTGVDTAYFRQLLDALKEKSDATGKVDESYLMDLIDRIV